MRFINIIAGVAALASAVVAQSNTLQFRGLPNLFEAGRRTTITYVSDDIDSPVTITLRKGASNDLETIDTITSTATGGTFAWNVPSDLPAGADYALQITQGSEINYSGQFAITGGTPSPSSSSEDSSASETATETDSSATSKTTAAPTGSNSTMTLSNTTRGPTSTRRTQTATATDSSETSAPSDDAAAGLRSPLALVFGAVAAVAYLG